MPWPLAYTVQPWFFPPAPLALHVSLSVPPPNPPAVFRRLEEVHITLLIVLSGLPKDADARADLLSITWQAPDGASSHPAPFDRHGIPALASATGAVTFSEFVPTDRAFFNSHRDILLTLRGSLYVTLLGRPCDKQIRPGAAPANIAGGVQCYTGMAEWDIYCRAPFRWPSRMV